LGRQFETALIFLFVAFSLSRFLIIQINVFRDPEGYQDKGKVRRKEKKVEKKNLLYSIEL